jgi:hypothetical protein
MNLTLTWPDRFRLARTTNAKIAGCWPWRRSIPRFAENDVRSCADWATCAFGEQYALAGMPENVALVCTVPHWRLPTQMLPEDEYLCSLGTAFFEAVKNDRVDDAEALYARIGQRIAQLVARHQLRPRLTTSWRRLFGSD